MERAAVIVEEIWRSWQTGEEPERLEHYRLTT